MMMALDKSIINDKVQTGGESGNKGIGLNKNEEDINKATKKSVGSIRETGNRDFIFLRDGEFDEKSDGSNSTTIAQSSTENIRSVQF
ncbi:hypothetical protein RCL_jg15711.t1 [Rhizophagus clarus]|uniref:Uncharacterized protein n=1 Tax=Rhizophagus clarus TaxID=94130 RepID=A0A8H3MD33_9GLOM|nr:hypothetical protein RCL_jg15711.t1 [Rhizophagus clarus]